MDTGKIYYGQHTSNVETVAEIDAASKKHLLDQMDNMRKADMDSFEKIDISASEVCGCYPNYQINTSMPKSIFGDSYGYDMQKEISSHMRDYYAGNVSKEELGSYFEECCTYMRIYRMDRRQTSGTNTADNEQIISEMYEMFAKENQRAARNVNYSEGMKINYETYGSNTKQDDWVYYNSDYYYECTETKSNLRDFTSNIASKWDVGEIDPEEIEQNSKLTLDGGFDFNSGWNFTYRNQVGRSSMQDESMIPPEDFEFFYKESVSPNSENMEEALKGNMSVSTGGHRYNFAIPFEINRDSLVGQIFEADDLTGDTFKDKKTVKDFLSGIYLFTRWYSFETGINNTFR